MAQSRLERIGTIYTRISSLIKGKAMKPEDKPIWYELYEAFPPKREPRFSRAAPNIPVRDIFYKEDPVRARFQREHSRFTMNLLRHDAPSQTQKFLSIYNELEKSGMTEAEVYEKAVQKWTEQNIETKEFKFMDKSRETSDQSQVVVEKPSTNISDIFKQ